MERPKLELNDGSYQAQCHACLSVGRKMIFIGELAEMYENITSGITSQQVHTNINNVEICWECYAVLRKVQRFQTCVKRAQDILLLGQNYLYGTLSNLTTIIIKESHPNTIFLNENPYIHTDIVKKESYDVLSDILHHDHDGKNYYNFCQDDDTSCQDDDKFCQDVDKLCHIEDSHCDERELNTNKISSMSSMKGISNENVISRKNETENGKQRKTRWAAKRALQNKKPKYKILEYKNLNIETAFKRVQIDSKEMQKQGSEGRCYKSRYKCEPCNLDFKTKSSITKHKRKANHDILRFICDICQAGFSKKSVLATHIQNHGYKYRCCLCQYTCYRKRQRSKHLEKYHKSVFQCLKCRMQFGTNSEFSKHYKEWHEKFICDDCGVSFKMRYCIKEHIRKKHSPFKCQQCNKTFARYNSLWLHNKTQHEPATSPAYCVECDKRYVDVYRYRWHLANSAKHRPKKVVRIPCPGCEKVFSKKIYMKDHYNLVHLKQYKYRCDKCNKNFIRNADLVKHTRRVHDGILPPKDKICYVCGKGFTTNKILSAHVRTHTGERPYACALCPARFTQCGALIGHKRALHQQ